MPLHCVTLEWQFNLEPQFPLCRKKISKVFSGSRTSKIPIISQFILDLGLHGGFLLHRSSLNLLLGQECHPRLKGLTVDYSPSHDASVAEAESSNVNTFSVGVNM